MSSFTSQDDLCGSRLQSLVCKGHILITKVLQVSNELPPAFLAGYAIDEFKVIANNENKNKDSSSASSSTSSFFGSSVFSLIGNVTGSGKSQHHNHDHPILIRSQAPSYKQSSHYHHQHTVHPSTSKSTSAGNDKKDQGLTRHDNPEHEKFKSIITDFSYLSNPEKFDVHNSTNNCNNNSSKTPRAKSYKHHKEKADQIVQKSDSELEQLEREFAFKYQQILRKYYQLFECIYNFYLDVNKFTCDLEKGFFINYNLRSLLLLDNHNDNNYKEARQLLCELLYLSASLLILLEMYIPGEIRERLIIAHYRFCETTNSRNVQSSNFEELCKMFQRTEYHPKSTQNNIGNSSGGDSASSIKARYHDDVDKKSLQPQIQPELLSRIPIPSKVVKQIMECLISNNDLYPNQSFAFPSYEQRSCRLGQQGAILFVTLFFDPILMKENKTMMRQVVDNFFHDSWVVPLYNGAVIDLSVEWNHRFPAAKDALAHVIDAANIQRLNYENMKVTIACIDDVKRYLTPNVLTTTFLLDYGEQILDFLRLTNSALRWQILHRMSHLCPKAANDTSAMIIDEHDMLSLILLISQLEVQLIDAYRKLLRNKESIWSKCRDDIVEKMTKLSRYFLSNDSLNSIEKNEDVGRWFQQMVNEIQGLIFHDGKMNGEIHFCIEALDDVRRLDLIDSNQSSLEIIEEARTNLIHMAKTANVKNDICNIIDLIADFTYAREIMESLVPMLHSQSMRDPKSVTLLRAFFLKMGRFSHRLQLLADKEHTDLACVTEFHENAMLSFVKETLDVIPITIFSTLAHIADEKSLAQLPAKIEADRLAEYLHFKDRYNLVKITYELSVLTKGIFAMKKTLIGNLEIKPKSLLEEGLRKELIRQYSIALHNSLQFHIPAERSKETLDDHILSCTNIFATLGSRIEGFQRSMIWLQDFLEIDGLKIFIHETSRVMKVNVEREMMNLTEKYPSMISSTENGLRVPLFSRSGSDTSAATFLGRTMNALIMLTDPKLTTYSYSLNAWYFPSGEEVCGLRMISKLRKAIGTEGLIGIDKVLCCKVRNELDRFFKFYSNIQVYGAILEQFRDAVFPEWKSPKGGTETYEIALRRIVKLMVPLTKSFLRIGQLQLLRKVVFNDLQLAADSKMSHSCIVANKLVMINYKEQGIKIEIDESMEKFAGMIAACGLTDPMATVFCKTNSMEGLPSLITLFVIHTIRELSYDSEFGALAGKEDVSIDGWSLVAGVATVLKQFNGAYTKSVFALLGQYVRTEDLPRLSTEVQNILIFMKQLCSIARLDSTILFDQIPNYLMEILAVVLC